MLRVRNFVLNMIGESRKANFFFLTSLLFLCLIAFIIVHRVWVLSIENIEADAIKLASVAKAGLINENVKSLEANESDLNKDVYIETKSILQQIVTAHENIRFAYVFVKKGDRIYFAVDSEPVDSKDYSPPGQEYTEATSQTFKPYCDGMPLIVRGTDRWGTWMSVLVPMTDNQTGELIALFGVDYTISEWYQSAVRHTVETGVLAFCVILVFLFLAATIRSNIILDQQKRELSETNEKLQKEQELFRTIYEQSPVGISVNVGGELTCNSMYEKITGYSVEEFKRKGWEAITHPDDLKQQMELVDQFNIDKVNTYKMNKRYVRPDDSLTWANITVAPIRINSDSELDFMCIIEDITERKRKEDEILFLNNHDYLTGIYNRRFLEMEKVRMNREDLLPLSILIGDINGVKLVNDALGHAEGDILIKGTAKIMQACCRENDVVARTGGDEFMMLMPLTDRETANERMNYIKAACDQYNQNLSNEAYSINISLGFATKESIEGDIDQTIKVAEDYMYKRKLLEHKSFHSVILSAIKATMHEKSHETQEHAERLTCLSRELGKKMKLSQQELDELVLVATLHDIGKVGIDDQILNKSGKLNEEEWVEMKKHSEIGYRIAMSSPDLVPIADYILALHECWDGTGYPQGIKGEEIPLLSRIVSVVDAYDAMTEDRTYRNAMPAEEAATELRKNSGTQFDPKVVKVFLEKILPHTF